MPVPPTPNEARVRSGGVDTVPVGTVSAAADVASSGDEEKDPDDNIELPADVDMDEHLRAMTMVCPDLLGGRPCREPASCSAASSLCQKFQVVGVSKLLPFYA
jgi:hypothetical protein